MSNEHDNFDFDDKTIIKVVGVGGGGINALNCMFNAGLKGVEYIAVDTDKKALSQSLASVHIPLISKAGDGRGNSLSTNAIPNIGGKVAEEYRKEIREALKGADMVFIVAVMGGDTGTNAALVVAKCAKEVGLLLLDL